MALIVRTVSLTAAETGTFTFPTPTGNYGKIASVEISDGGEPVALAFAADSASLGTTTGTINVSAPVTGTVEVIIYDRP